MTNILSTVESWDIELTIRIKGKVLRFKVQSLDELFYRNQGPISSRLNENIEFVSYFEFRMKVDYQFQELGSMSFNWNPDSCELHLGILWIEPEFRKNGYASLLLSKSVSFVDKHNITITLLSLPFINPDFQIREIDVFNKFSSSNKKKSIFRKLLF